MKKTTSLITTCGILCCSIASASPWLVRLRGIDVMPSVSSSPITVIGGKVTSISDSFVPELDFSYFVTPNWSAELILATSRHSVKATGTALGTVNLGKVNALPPTLTLQYRPIAGAIFNPYVGVGLNVTHFFNANAGPVATAIHYNDSVGPALQFGVDFNINNNWSINIDAKKIYMQSDVTVYALNHQLNTTVNLNPWVIGGGIGYHFG